MTLTSRIYSNIHGLYTGSNDMANPIWDTIQTAALLKELATGTGANQADLVFADQRTLAASATENLDLAGGLTDPLGATLTFVKVKGIYVFALVANTNNVVVGGVGANAFVGPFGANTETLTIPPGGSILLAAPNAGWTVTAGTGDLLKMLNSAGGTGVTYDIVIIGTSA